MSDLLSPDGHYRWSGSAWVPVAPLLSPDGNYWWSGTEWVPITAWPNSPAAATTFYGAPPILTEGGTEGFAIVSLVLGLLFFVVLRNRKRANAAKSTTPV